MELRTNRFLPKPVFREPDCGELLRLDANGLNGDAANICESPNHSVDCTAELRCCPSLFPSHGKPTGQVFVFDVSRPATQRVLKLPFWTRRLNASSQLNGIFSMRPSARGDSFRFSLSADSALGAGTALHLSLNDTPESRSAL